MKATAFWRAVVVALALGGAVGARGEAVRGFINGWPDPVVDWMGPAFTGDTIMSSTLPGTDNMPASGFKFDQSGNWNTQWGSGASATSAVLNVSIGQAHINQGGNNPGNLVFFQQMFKRYTFRLKGEASWWYRPYVVMETTNAPISIPTVSDNSVAAGTGAVTVSATLSAAPSGETIYVRYTTNAFTHSSLVAGTVAGTTATLTIPAMVVGRVVQYYVLTSTMPFAVITNDFDLCTLRANVNGGPNYTYTVQNPVLDPIVSVSGTTTIKLGAAFSLAFSSANFSGTPTWSHTVTPAIAGSALTPASGAGTTFSATPTTAGTNSLQVKATAGGVTVTNNTTLVVNLPNYGEAWHEPLSPVQGTSVTNMRNPVAPSVGASVYVYAGNYQADASGADMNAGVVWYRQGTSGAWSSTNMAWNNDLRSAMNDGTVKNWFTGLPTSALAEGTVMQYVIQVGYNNRDTTFLGTADQISSVKHPTLVAAQAAPYSFTVGAYIPNFGHAFHIPSEFPTGWLTPMRNPLAPEANKDVGVFVGSFPASGLMRGGTLYYSIEGGATKSLAMTSNSVAGANVIWGATLPKADLVEGNAITYWFGITFDAGYDTVYLGTTDGSDCLKFATEPAAKTKAYTFTVGAYIPNFGSAFHIPAEPPSGWLTPMRNPLAPEANKDVGVFVGSYPASGLMRGGTLYYSVAGGATKSLTMTSNSVAGANVIWGATLPKADLVEGNAITYWFGITFDAGYDAVFLGTSDGSDCLKFATEPAAKAKAYTFTVGAYIPNFGHAFHIPAELPSGWSTPMRNPLAPEANQEVGIFVASYSPQGAMSSGSLKYAVNGGTPQVVALVTNAVAGGNDIWASAIPKDTLQTNDVVTYWFQIGFVAGYDATFLGTADQTNSAKFATEAAAKAAPFTFTVAAHVPVLGEAWHEPDAFVKGTTITMRDPLNPGEGQNVTVYAGNFEVDGGTGGNMTNGVVWYRGVVPSARKSIGAEWTRSDMTHFRDVRNDEDTGFEKYWKAVLSTEEFVEGALLQYVIEVQYSNFDATFIGTNEEGESVTFADLEEAQEAAVEVVFEEEPEFKPGNIWHFPGNREPWESATMRNPTNPTPRFNTYIYVGNHHTTADMTGGRLFYKKSTDSTWTSNNLTWTTAIEQNAFWQAIIPSNAVALGETLQYYIQVDYANGGADTTYLGTSNQLDNAKYAKAADAALHPFAVVSAASFGNAWHCPVNAEPAGAFMRNPRHPYADQAVTIYNGNQFSGTGNVADQNGGMVYYRLKDAATWTAVAMGFDSELANNKYWNGAIPANIFVKNQTVEYVLGVTYNDRDATFLGTTNGVASTPFATLDDAKAKPFSFTFGDDPGKEAGFIWHGGNTVRVAGDAVQIWVKIGFEEYDGYRWVDNAKVNYRVTTGSSFAPKARGVSVASKTTKAKFVSADLTETQDMIFSHTESDPSPNGNVMWWVATIQDDALADINASLEYEIVAWNSLANGGNGVERKAEYRTDGIADALYAYRMAGEGSGALTVNGQSADYTTTKFFIDEAKGQTVPISVRFTPPAGATDVEVFSNVGRRDFADADVNADGVPDGILPPDGNWITKEHTGAYFAAFPMTWNSSAGAYTWNADIGQCGAYRLTARYKASGSTNWSWYSSEGRRDHAIVISPTKVLQQTMYELNALTVKATSATEAGRSTFADLIDSEVISTNSLDTFDEFSVEYLNKLQANCLWFQPIHPSGYDRSENEPGTSTRYNPGSPYATRDYFSVNHFFGRAGTEEAALEEFQSFVAHCDTAVGTKGNTNYIGTVNVMLDGVFNHTSWDAEFGEMGVEMGFCTNKNDRIGWFKPGWYSYWQDYGSPATYYHTAWSNDIATSPDRGDFGKWADAAELYYGKYSALVRHNPDENGSYLNEQDVFDFAGMSQDTIDLWKYIGKYAEFWLKKTGHSGVNTFGATNEFGMVMDDIGIDGLRCDFGQGLPPQLWEYIINRTRSMKWNFMFMAETLDGGVPGYRSNRHFDILNESLVFQFTQAHVSKPWDLRAQLDSRRTAYGGGAVLLNLTGHDEIMPWSDPWVTASRYAMVSSVMGVPMIFYGQEQGIGPYQGAADKWTGFADFELNFGKYVPHFKRWNQLRIWDEPPMATEEDARHMAQWHGRINWARLNSPALQSANQYYLGKKDGGGDNPKIFALAKYEEAGASPDAKDVVLAFTLFVNENDHSGANETYSLVGCWNLLGLENRADVFYNIRNLAADVAETYLWSTPRSGATLYNEGIWVSFDSDGGGRKIYDNGAIVQYLKIETVEPADMNIVFTPASPITVPYKELAQFTVRVTGADGNPLPNVVTNLVGGIAGMTFANGQFSYTVNQASWIGKTNGIEFTAQDSMTSTNAWMSVIVPFDSNANGIPDEWERNYFPNYTNTAAGDPDTDKFSNLDEYIANTSPVDINDFFHLTDIRIIESPVGRQIVFKASPARTYWIEYSDSLQTGTAVVWNTFQANGTWENTTAATSHFFTDDGTATTSGTALTVQRTYRVKVRLP